MEIYTSYFAKTKELVEEGILPIGVALIPPSFFTYPNFACVAPTKSILFQYKSEPDEQRYIERYKNEVLVILKDPQVFVDGLKAVSHGKDVALCCFEKSDDFCHRHILAEFLNEKLGLNIREYQFKPQFSCEPLF